MFRAYLKSGFLVLFCVIATCSAQEYDEKAYISEEALVQTDDGLFFYDSIDQIIPITELYMDDQGYYILLADYNKWNCRCCGYDLNVKKDYCAKCKGSRWWCE